MLFLALIINFVCIVTLFRPLIERNSSMPTLDFKGKSFVYNHHLAVKYHQLIPEPELSLTDNISLHDNLIIHGDNLKALKALLPTYAGKIKCIYIDPLYNTGNEKWVYNDNVNSPMLKEWLGKVVDKEDLTRHDKWLCMMLPRLKLLRELLSEDGVIFISIDDNEQHVLRSLMDEIFGEANFIALLPTIMNLKGNQDEFAFAGTHEYTLVFANSKPNAHFYHFNVDDKEENNWEIDEIGYFKKGANLKSSGTNASRKKRINLFYPIIYNPVTKELFILPDNELAKIADKRTKEFNDEYLLHLKKLYTKKGFVFIIPVSGNEYMSWRWESKKIIAEKHNLIISNADGEISIYKKQRPALGDLPSKKPKTLFYKPEYSSGNGTNQIKSIF